jgi:Spy/CpxP family protein refolding chaperone
MGPAPSTRRERNAPAVEDMMHPGFFGWWKGHHGGHACGGSRAHFGAGWDEGGWQASAGDDVGGGGPFGVRRPLRFLAFKLGLSEPQVNALARILNDLKTERAQAAVDNRRAVATFADAVGGDAFDEARARAAAEERVKSAAKLRDAVVKALGEIHAILQPGQREQLAYLIRTGTLLI